MLASPRQRSHCPEVGPTPYRSLGLEMLLREISRGRKQHILDLGYPTGSNLEYFASRMPCRFYVGDLYRVVHGGGATKQDIAGVLDSFIPSGRDVCFDIILGWDVFNYLDREALGALMAALAPYCGAGTLLFTLISTQEEIPAQPLRFKVLDEGHLIYEQLTAETVTCPRFTAGALERILPEFSVLRSFLLRNGIQEFLFRHR